MAKITLKDLSHSYLKKPSNNADADWALKDINIDWKDGELMPYWALLAVERQLY